MRRRRPKSLAARLPALIVLAVLLTGGAATVLALYLGRSALKASALATTRSSVQVYANALQAYLAAARAQVETVGQSSAARELLAGGGWLPREAASHEVAAVLRASPIFEYVAVIRADGRVVLIEPAPVAAGESRGERRFAAWFRELVQSGSTVVSDLHVSPATQRPAVVIATPVRDAGGRVIGAIAGTLRLGELSKFGADAEGGHPTLYGFVTDRRGLVIAHQARRGYVEHQTDFGSLGPVRQALAGATGSGRFFNPVERTWELGAWTPLPAAGWAVAYVQPLDVALQPVVRLTRALIAASVLLVAGLGLLAFRWVNAIVGPIRALTQAADVLAQGGRIDPLEVRTGDEVERLARAFNAMAAALAARDAELGSRASALEAANAALRWSEERYRVLGESVPQLVWMTGPGGAAQYFNRRWFEYTGLEPAETLGSGWQRVVHPDDRPEALRHWTAAIAAGEPCEVECRLRRADGAYRWHIARAVPLRHPAGGVANWFGTWTDIDGRKRTEAEREALLTSERAARAEAQAAIRTRDTFLARASHELRTPLTSALGTVRLLQRAQPGGLPDSPDGLLAVADRNLTAMAALINDLLDASKLTAGQETLTRERVDLAEVVGHSLQVVGPQAGEKGVGLRAAVPEGLALSADRLKLEQVLVNLLANAVKFTPAGGTVTVEAGREADGVAMRVRDTGEGIAPDQLERIFEPFYQAGGLGESRITDRRARRVRGTGLGLAICRQIVTLHGGRIWAESEGPGRGSTFVVVLPQVASGAVAA
jgi:PAS domain S-box-containing protein